MSAESVEEMYRYASTLPPDSREEFLDSQLRAKKTLLLIFTFVLALFLTVPFIRHLPQILGYFSAPSYRPIGIVILGVVALVLFAIRLFARAFYAVSEIAFASVVAWDGFATVYTEGFGKWPVIIAAMYLLVRGFDNLHEGLGTPFKPEDDKK